jgi:hypothetical protein
MANADLLRKQFPFPKSLLARMAEVNNKQFSTKIKHFVKQGFLTYYDLKNFINDYPTLSDEEKNSHGGDIFFNWVTNVLNKSRERVKQHKKNLTDAGSSNMYIKPHEKTLAMNANTDKHIYENTYKIYVSEQTFKKIKYGNL